MANVLAELFQNVAKAIREKTGETGKMKPMDFPEKIRAIQTGGAEADLRSLVVTENGTYYPTENLEHGKTYTLRSDFTQEELQAFYEASLGRSDDGMYAFLCEINGEMLGIMYAYDYYGVYISNGYLWLPEEFATEMGFSAGWNFGTDITDLSPTEAPTVSFETYELIISGGLTALNPLFVLNEFEGFSEVEVNVPETVPELEEITITENGTYAPSEKDGFSRVTVNVEAESTGEGPQLYTPSIERSGESITITNPAANGSFVRKYKIYDNEILVSEQNSKSYNLSNLTYGTHLIEVASAGEKFKDSEKSNAVNANKYSITMNLTNVNTSFSKAYALHGDSVTITFTLPSVYYAMPDTITATMGGSTDGIIYIKDDRKITIESVTGDIDIAITSKEVKLLDDLSWDTIAAYAADGTLEEQFQIGDSKNLTIYTDDTTSVTVPFAIAAFHHDDLADGSGKANVTFIAKKGFRLTGTKSLEQWKSWQTVSNRTHFQSGGIVYDNLPQALKDSLKSVTKKQAHSSYHGNRTVNTSSDKIFWLSLTEVGLTYEKCLEIEGEPYPIFTDDASRKRQLSGSSTYYLYPLRDRQDDSTDGLQFAGVGNNGAFAEWKSSLGSFSYYQFINIIGFCL